MNRYETLIPPLQGTCSRSLTAATPLTSLVTIRISLAGWRHRAKPLVNIFGDVNGCRPLASRLPDAALAKYLQARSERTPAHALMLPIPLLQLESSRTWRIFSQKLSALGVDPLFPMLEPPGFELFGQSFGPKQQTWLAQTPCRHNPWHNPATLASGLGRALISYEQPIRTPNHLRADGLGLPF